jgi:hypothetical protein
MTTSGAASYENVLIYCDTTAGSPPCILIPSYAQFTPQSYKHRESVEAHLGGLTFGQASKKTSDLYHTPKVSLAVLLEAFSQEGYDTVASSATWIQLVRRR